MSSERPKNPFSLAPDRTSFAVSDLKQARDQSFDKTRPSPERQPE
ncbi:hypothetical protein ACFQ1E_19740 [Sphingomonas canadensis]|uniref:Uncharacterized protein n=1 Tax=Sphingomonas canadensis TaxID=1219257 RepID=A0ABW3HAQ9_9SPHN|nr:hypothetical protein [Sphingomonas canadensis]MCW3838230.1 hypothetical protein [Sphingomonas canadensis]